jgi:hypothetical protein
MHRKWIILPKVSDSDVMASHVFMKITHRKKHNRSEMVAVLGPNEALPYYIHIHTEMDRLRAFLES